MKLKARDIVSGWPKPRSTSVFLLDRADIAWIKLLNPNKSLADLEANLHYHQEQQAMMDKYFERWRTPVPLDLYPGLKERLAEHGILGTCGVIYED